MEFLQKNIESPAAIGQLLQIPMVADTTCFPMPSCLRPASCLGEKSLKQRISWGGSGPFRFGIILFSIVGATIPMLLRSAPMAISWEGTVTNVTSFTENPALSGLVPGVPISGSVIFDMAESASSGLIQASDGHGMRFRFGSPFTQTIAAAGHRWIIGGGSLSLVASIWGDQEAIDVFSTSERDLPVFFPNYVGHFEGGFALFDKSPPLTLFGVEPSFDIDLDQVTSGSGFLTTRKWENSEIVAGYYITFVIDKASRGEIPEYRIRARADSVKKGRTYGSGAYAWGDRVLVKAAPNRGVRFLYWTENGKRLSHRRIFSVTSDRPRNFVAHFR